MQLKMHAYITRPVLFARGDYEYALSLHNKQWDIPDWLYVGPITLVVSDSHVREATRIALRELNEQEEKVKAELTKKLADIDRVRQELQALPPPEVEGDGAG